MYELYKRLRDSKGVTDYKVCKETGISRSTMTEWSNGKYTPKSDKLMKLAEYFDVPISYFYGEDGADKQQRILNAYYEAFQNIKVKKLIDSFQMLDGNEQKQVQEFVDALVLSKQYKKALDNGGKVG